MSCTTTTVTKTFDNVITYEPPPVKLQTVYAPHTVHTFYNSYRVPRLHTVYKSVSPPRIHTVISTPRLHTIHTEPARVETSIIKVTPSKPAATTTTTTTVAPALYHPLLTHWSYPRFYDDHVIDVKVERASPLRSRSTVSVVRNVDVSDIVSNRYEYVHRSSADLTVEETTTTSAAEPAAEPAAAEPAPAAEPAKTEETSSTTTTTTHSFLRPSKSFNGLNTLTYSSYVYDLNHGHDLNHQKVTVTKEVTESVPVTVTTTVPASVVTHIPVTIPCPYALHSKSFFVGDLRNFSINNDGVRWYGAHPRWYPRSLRYWY